MTDEKPTQTLQDVLDSVPNLVDHLYSNRKGSVLKDTVLRQPTEFVAPEFTTWGGGRATGVARGDCVLRPVVSHDDDLPAWPGRPTAAVQPGREQLRDLRSRSLPTLRVLPAPTAITSATGSLRRRPRGDGGRGSGGRPQLDSVLRRDRRVGRVRRGRRDLSNNPAGRRTVYRYQVEGPHALELVERLIGAPLPEAPRSHIIPVSIAGRQVWAWRHTMAGNPGCEFFGPGSEGPAVKEAILEAGSALDLRRVGSLAYFTNTLELGWIPRPVPAIFTADELRPFREWLPATSSEATWGLGGSFTHPTSRTITSRHEARVRQCAQVRPRVRRARSAQADGGRRSSAEGHAHLGSPDVARRRIVHAADSRRFTSSSPGRPAYWQSTRSTTTRDEQSGVSTYTGFSWNERAMLTRHRRARARQARDPRLGSLGGTGGWRQEPSLAGAPPPGRDRRHSRAGSDRVRSRTITAAASPIAGRSPGTARHRGTRPEDLALLTAR